jgi:hypothetical protein
MTMGDRVSSITSNRSLAGHSRKTKKLLPLPGQAWSEAKGARARLSFGPFRSLRSLQGDKLRLSVTALGQ